MGGRGGNSSTGENRQRTNDKKFIEQLEKDMDNTTSGDLQAMAEAYAMRKLGTDNYREVMAESERLLEKARNLKTEKTQDTMTEIKQLQKQITTAKAQESRLLKEFQKASGGYRMAQTRQVREEQLKERTKAWNRYVDAQGKRSELENKLYNITKKYRQTESEDTPF